jgi:uncharacterized protein (DUF1697 family)
MPKREPPVAEPARTTHVALLRSINVGGKNKLAMDDLAALFREAGCDDVRTFIQSGNVLLRASPRVAAGLAADATARIRGVLGFEVPVVLRTTAELAAVPSRCPFLGDGADTEQLHVMFLADRPDARAVASLDPDRSPADEAVVVDREVYLRLPNGMGRTKLTSAYFDARLGTLGTARNWRTVTKLIELATA